ncbi:MAG: S-layer homology domain-containing protein [bacterium]
MGEDEWFAEAVQVLTDQGIVRGKADGSFRPYASITRAEFAVLLSRALDLPPGVTHPFTDFPSGSWFEPEVAALFEAGLTDGVSPTEFDPYGRVSRQQTVSFVVRALAYRLSLQPVEGLDLTLTSSQVESWLQGFPDRGFIAGAHQAAVASAYRLQVVSGHSDGLFYPLADVTRAQSVGMLYAALFKTPSLLAEPPTPVSAVLAYPAAKVGSQGPQVLWLEQRLADLTYRPGPVDGVFDHRTHQAVIAFQKWEGMSRDGVVGSEMWMRVMAASRPTADLSGSGVWIEVSLAKQVFLYVESGTVTRTLPTSTGRSYSYRSLPYTVQRKPIADGPRYRALYLNPGNVLAIHGYPSVPTYPASDGCVRLPKWDMDDLRAMDGSIPMIPDGTMVHIH